MGKGQGHRPCGSLWCVLSQVEGRVRFAVPPGNKPTDERWQLIRSDNGHIHVCVSLNERGKEPLVFSLMFNFWEMCFLTGLKEKMKYTVWLG